MERTGPGRQSSAVSNGSAEAGKRAENIRKNKVG